MGSSKSDHRPKLSTPTVLTSFHLAPRAWSKASISAGFILAHAAQLCLMHACFHPYSIIVLSLVLRSTDTTEQ
ncbi:hypothetical protein BJX65DRAFT_274623 [Aspergillus insuetus]